MTTKQTSNTNELIQMQTIQCSKHHDRNLVVDPLWYTQPVKDCNSISDVVVASKPKLQTSCSVEHRMELSLV